MSSLRTVPPSKTSGSLSKGPSTPAGTLRSEKAIIRGLCADCIVLEDEERQNFLNLLQQHIDHFRPVDEVEFGLVEEMCAARWRQRRAWSIETRMFDTQIARRPDGDSLDRMVVAIDVMAAAPSLSLVHRYETRLNLAYQRSLRTLIMLRTVKFPNEPNPISERPPETIEPTTPAVEQPPLTPQAIDPEALGSACFSLYQPAPAAPRPPKAAPATASHIAAEQSAGQSAAQPVAPPRVRGSGGGA